MLIDYILSGVWSPTDWREYGISQQSSYAALHNPGFPFPQGGRGNLSTVQGFRYRGGRGLADLSNVYPESIIATIPLFGLIEGHKWFFIDFQPMRVSEELVCIILNPCI